VVAGASRHLQLLKRVVNRENSGAARFCTVMVEMSTGLPWAGQEDSYSAVTYITP
jgi:hypothetical protein